MFSWCDSDIRHDSDAALYIRVIPLSDGIILGIILRSEYRE